MIWTVSAPARLHFGLIDLSGDHGRLDGGAGIAIEAPRVVVTARRGTGELELSPRAADLARAMADRLRIDLSTLDLAQADQFPAHMGLGSHTQLALALGTAMCRAAGLELTTREVAGASGRGGTSGIGVNVFDGGGLIVDGGHSFGPGQEKESCLPSSASRASTAPLLARYRLPERWRFALITPRTAPGAHGSREVSLFQEAFPLPAEDTGEVCRRVLMGVMPGAAAGDLELLGRSLSALQRIGFKRREVSLQPQPVRELLDVAVEAGAAGAGLSSFGPTVYALTGDRERAEAVVAAAVGHLSRRRIEAETWIAAPDNQGAQINASPEES